MLPKPVISAMGAAPRARALSKDSMTSAPAPSPATNPPRRASKGSEASLGSSARVRADKFVKPAMQMGLTDSSVPPTSAASM